MLHRLLMIAPVLTLISCSHITRKNSTESSGSSPNTIPVAVEASKAPSEREYIWTLIAPSDFGEPLMPRKAYDFGAELKKYLECQSCQFSTQIAQIRHMMQVSTSADVFIWVLRPDGTFVVSRGPEDDMTHGVIASLNIQNPEMTHGPMGLALVAGEGWFDPSSKTLNLNNKSGHYRPEFSRLNNQSMRKIFDYIASPIARQIKFIDSTKPRSVPTPQPIETY